MKPDPAKESKGPSVQLQPRPGTTPSEPAPDRPGLPNRAEAPQNQDHSKQNPHYRQARPPGKAKGAGLEAQNPQRHDRGIRSLRLRQKRIRRTLKNFSSPWVRLRGPQGPEGPRASQQIAANQAAHSEFPVDKAQKACVKIELTTPEGGCPKGIGSTRGRQLISPQNYPLVCK